MVSIDNTGDDDYNRYDADEVVNDEMYMKFFFIKIFYKLNKIIFCSL